MKAFHNFLHFKVNCCMNYSFVHEVSTKKNLHQKAGSNYVNIGGSRISQGGAKCFTQPIERVTGVLADFAKGICVDLS